MNKSQSTLLFFYHSNKRSVVFETIIEKLVEKKYRVIFLSLSPQGELQNVLRIFGVHSINLVSPFKNKVVSFLWMSRKLIFYCKVHKVNVVWSHLHQASLLMIFAQFFIRARVVIFRHHLHSDLPKTGIKINFKEKIADKLISFFAKEIVVPSNEVFDGMVIREKINRRKITVIPYIYNFSKYPIVENHEITSIRNLYPSKMLIVTASRMIKLKRHAFILQIYKELIEEGLNIKVLLFDDGPEKRTLESFVFDNDLSNHIYFLGFRKDLYKFLASADLLVHPSLTEASSSLVKEMGYYKNPVIVSKDVGDFNSYIINDFNGYLVEPSNEYIDYKNYIQALYFNNNKRIELGNNLSKTVIDKFGTNSEAVNRYEEKLI